MKDFNVGRKVANQYLKARADFLKKADNIEHLLGNDNIIGRIGEFVAIQFLAEQKRIAKKHPQTNNESYDLLINGKITVSVKTITSEGRGKTTKIKDKWHELILITLNDNYKVECIGHISKEDFNRALKDKRIGKQPVASKTMLSDRGLIGIYGTVRSGSQVKHYL